MPKRPTGSWLVPGHVKMESPYWVDVHVVKPKRSSPHTTATLDLDVLKAAIYLHGSEAIYDAVFSTLKASKGILRVYSNGRLQKSHGWTGA